MTKNQFTIFIYDEVCQPLRINVDVFLFKDTTNLQLNHDSVTRQLPNEMAYGVIIPFQIDEPAPVSVIINDESKKYFGYSYQHLNGIKAARLDLILYCLPGIPGDFGDGGDPDLDTVPGIIRRIRQQDGWRDTERRAVENLVTGFVSFVAPNLEAQSDPSFARIKENWSDCLKFCGIPMAPLTIKEKAVYHSIAG